MTIRLTRREFALAGSAAMLAVPAAAQNAAPLMRPIPSSGERRRRSGLARLTYSIATTTPPGRKRPLSCRR